MDANLWDIVKLAGLGLGGFFLGRLYERWKPITFRVSKWQVKYLQEPNSYGEILYSPSFSKAKEARCEFVFLLFNTKSAAVGLHEVALEFCDDRDNRLFRVDGSCDNLCPTYIDLLANKTTPLEGSVAIEGSDSDLLVYCRYIYLTALATESKRKRRWLITDYEHPRA